MSDLDQRPAERTCAAGDHDGVQVIAPRDVPLGGPRAMNVRRTLPGRDRSLIGAWCFIDHYGPDRVADTGGMQVTPHPHTGLATVSWLFTGEIEHRDSAGHHAMVRPGELNLMTAGRGISHSEMSTADTATLHGLQLWFALPEQARDGDPGFVHYAPHPVRDGAVEARVFLGSLLGDTSPVATPTPLLGAEIAVPAGVRATLDVDPAFEHGLIIDRGTALVSGAAAGPGDLVYLPPGVPSLVVEADDTPVRALVLGGPPFGEQIVMWWNFVGRSHEEIVAYRDLWQAQVAPGGSDRSGRSDRSATLVDGHFGVPVGDPNPPIPAPPLPNARLKPRG